MPRPGDYIASEVGLRRVIMRAATAEVQELAAAFPSAERFSEVHPRGFGFGALVALAS